MAHIIPFPAPQQTSYLRVETKFGPEFISVPTWNGGLPVPDSDELDFMGNAEYFDAFANIVGLHTEMQPLAWIKVN